VSENTRLVVVLHEMTDSLSASIDTLRERYKAAFRQESVMRVDVAVERWDF
jgi:radical SAM superfamily enzyme